MLHFKIGLDIQELRFSIHTVEKILGNNHCNIVLSKYPFITLMGVEIIRVTQPYFIQIIANLITINKLNFMSMRKKTLILQKFMFFY